MRKAARILSLVFGIVSILAAVGFIIFGILCFTDTAKVAKEINQTANETKAVGAAFIGWAVYFVMAGVVCFVTFAMMGKKLSPKAELVLGILSLVADSIPAGVLLIVLSAQDRRKPQVE